MCSACLEPGAPSPSASGRLSRRRLLAGGVALGLSAAAPLGWADRAEASPGSLRDTGLLTRNPRIHPREDWAGTTRRYAPKGRMRRERPGDVRYLLAHHGATRNSYTRDGTVGRLRSYYDLHTRGARDWFDIAYNFLVDRFGRIWEGRAGSLEEPVIGSASYGNQGFDQKVCWIGDHSSVKPTLRARASMVSIMAWLADRYDIDTRPGTLVTFTSRGSNRWPEGARVTTRTIEGHRRMSVTSCPGDAAYPFVRGVLPRRVTRLRRG